MAGPWKISYFFQQNADRVGGWSWSFYNTLTDRTAVNTATDALASAVWNLHGGGNNLNYVRVSDLSTPRAAKTYGYPGFQSLPKGASNDADFPTSSILLRANTVAFDTNSWWVRGCPDDLVQRGGHFTHTSTWDGYLAAFKSILVNASNGWALRFLDKTNKPIPIKSVSTTGQLITTQNHKLAVGTVVQVRVSRTAGIPGLNKLWFATPSDAVTMQLDPVPTGGFTGSLTTNGTVRLQTIVFATIADVQPLRASKHAVGRPFGELIGRRRARKK